MIIQGKVATIIYKNEVNSWTVMLIKLDKGYITAVGEAQDIDVGDEVEFEGEKGTHKIYGEQFKFTTYKKLLPKSDNALIQYIADNIKGIGKKTAKNILNEFGEDTIDIIRYSPSKLSSIKGLNQEKIDNLNVFFTQEWEKWNVVEYLSKFNISAITASNIFKVLGNDTINIIKQKPYSLIGLVKKIEFNIVDEIGKNIGISLDDDERINTGLIYVINKITEFGHTCVEKEELISYAAKILEVNDNIIENGIRRLIFDNKFYLQVIDEKEYIFRRSFYLAEENIANGIISSISNSTKKIDYTNQIKHVSKNNKLDLSDEQKEAISVCLNNHISIITGGPRNR